MEGPREEGEDAEQVLTGVEMSAPGRELMAMSAGWGPAATGTKGFPGQKINWRVNTWPQALGYSSLGFIFS